MTSGVFSLSPSSHGTDLRMTEAQDSNRPVACELCHLRKQKCVAGDGSCQACAAVGAECRPRERRRMGRPRASQPPSWIINGTVHQTISTIAAPSAAPRQAPPQNNTTDVIEQELANGDYFDDWLVSHEANRRTRSSTLVDDTLTLDVFPDPVTGDIFPDMMGGVPPIFPHEPHDLRLHNMHTRIRSLIGIFRNEAQSPSDRGAEMQRIVQSTEEVVDALQTLTEDRVMFLLGVAVLWDVADLSNIMIRESLETLGATLAGTPERLPLTSPGFGPHRRSGSEGGHPLSRLIATLPPSLRSKHSANLLHLTRLEICLGEFLAYLQRIETFARSVDDMHAQSMLDCRMGVAALQEKFSHCRYLITNPWPSLDRVQPQARRA